MRLKTCALSGRSTRLRTSGESPNTSGRTEVWRSPTGFRGSSTTPSRACRPCCTRAPWTRRKHPRNPGPDASLHRCVPGVRKAIADSQHRSRSPKMAQLRLGGSRLAITPEPPAASSVRKTLRCDSDAGRPARLPATVVPSTRPSCASARLSNRQWLPPAPSCRR